MEYNSDGTEKVCALLKPVKKDAQGEASVLAEAESLAETEVAALFKEVINDRPRKQD